MYLLPLHCLQLPCTHGSARPVQWSLCDLPAMLYSSVLCCYVLLQIAAKYLCFSISQAPRYLFTKYEGHPINKLLNGIILSIFRIWKVRDIRFVGNLFLNTSCEFHSGDVIMMTSPAFWTQSVSAVFYPAVFLHNSPALNSIASYEKNEQVHQADLLGRQTLTFIFQHKFHIHLNIYRIYQVNTREWTAAIVASVVSRHLSKQHGGQVVSSQQHFLDSEQTS